MKRAFTIPELIFIIILIALLTSIAIPKLMATRTDAKATRILEDVNTVRKEVVGYVWAKQAVQKSFKEMSPTADVLERERLGREEDWKLYIKVNKDEPDCIVFEIIKNNGVYQLNLQLIDTPNISPGCKIVQEHVYVVDYPINLLGQTVKYNGGD